MSTKKPSNNSRRPKCSRLTTPAFSTTSRWPNRRLGKYDDAYKNFVRAGGEVYGRLNIANRLQLAGRTDEAIKYFEAAKLTVENQQKQDPNAQAITVLLEIKNGKISFASLAEQRPGLETYEATALRFARKLRYPSDRNGAELVVVRVSPTPGS